MGATELMANWSAAFWSGYRFAGEKPAGAGGNGHMEDAGGCEEGTSQGEHPQGRPGCPQY